MKRTGIVLIAVAGIITVAWFMIHQNSGPTSEITPLESKIQEEGSRDVQPKLSPTSHHSIGSQAEAPSRLSKLDILNEVLNSQNDNDERLDADLKILNESEKQAFMDKYRSLAMEDRNGRGLIVFLIGRNLETTQDFAFLSGVFSEPYCRSIDNCSEGSKTVDEDSHHSSGDEVTLSYPQWAALKALEKWSETAPSGQRSAAVEALQAAQKFDHPKIAAYAAKILEKLSH